MARTTLCALSCFVVMLGCSPELVIESASDSAHSGEESSTTQGDGDGDEDGDEGASASASGDGDGDDPSTTGDGDGDDPSTTGDGDGDDPTTTGDGDGDDPSTTGDGDGDDPTTSGDGDGDPTTGDGDGDPGEELELPWVDCAEEGNLVSGNSNQDVNITWINGSGEIRKTFWLNYQGQRVPYSNLQPDAQAVQGTFEGHPWVITDADDNCIVIYLPGPQDADAFLD